MHAVGVDDAHYDYTKLYYCLACWLTRRESRIKETPDQRIIVSIRRFMNLLSISVLLALTALSFGATNGLAAAPGAQIIASPEPDWPQFRGPRRDGVSDERGLLQTWPEGGPKVLWSTGKLGRGYSSPVIVRDRIFITGEVEGELRLFALDRQGQPAWNVAHGGAWMNPYPGARATPTYSDGKLYLMNAHGRIGCFDAGTGREKWSVEVLERFGGKNITWGLSECLLVDDRAVYVTAGGSKALLVALDKENGSVLWQSAPLADTAGDGSVENASYVSPVLVRFAGRRLLVGCSLRHLYCADADTGTIQWTRRFPTAYGVISIMPALVGNGVFMTAPHGKDGALFLLQPPDGPGAKVGATEGWTTTLDTLQGCVLSVGNKIVGSFYGGRKGWAAVSAATGAILYQSSDLVKGAPLLADGRLYALCEDGWMRLLEAGDQQFHEHGRFRLAEAKRDAWAHPVVFDGRLYLRYHETLTSYDVRAPQAR
ncbi:MAG: PQQ-binding-like beta-propeller repeat protein [Verrucomicrobiota bacterium]|nr:PQQ-binding-like beta-propeller repeat protein [Verrucomicrobiota bacterium]